MASLLGSSVVKGEVGVLVKGAEKHPRPVALFAGRWLDKRDSVTIGTSRVALPP